MVITMLLGPAFAGRGVPLVTASSASFVFQGRVVGISECVAEDGSHPWSFVQFSVTDTIVGSGVPYAGEVANRFTVRVPAGTMPDGSRSAIEGMPGFAVGDRFIVPVHAASGTPAYLPFFVYGDGAYFRVFPDAQGGVVVTADGKLIQSTSVNEPLPGVMVRPARSVEPGGFPAGVDDAAVASSIAAYRAGVGYDGVNPPQGTWVGRMHVTSTEPVEVYGVGFYETAGECTAHLSGTYDGSTLALTGWCNAPRIGRMDVVVNGTWSDHWTGTMRLSASFDSNIAGLFTWSDTPWSTVRDFPDGFTAHTTNSMVAPSVPDEYEGSFELGEDPERNVEFVATWDGWRQPMTIAGFKQWLSNKAANIGNTGRAVNSLKNIPANCISVSPVAMP